MFANATGIIALTLAVGWMIYIFFFLKPKPEGTITLGYNADSIFQPGDSITVDGKKYEILSVKQTQLKVRKSR